MMTKDAVIAWCEEENKILRQQLELLQVGGKIFSFKEGKQIDDTEHWVNEYKKRISDLEAIIEHQVTKNPN